MAERLTSYSSIGFNIGLPLFDIPGSLETILAPCRLIWLIGGEGKTLLVDMDMDMVDMDMEDMDMVDHIGTLPASLANWW